MLFIPYFSSFSLTPHSFTFGPGLSHAPPVLFKVHVIHIFTPTILKSDSVLSFHLKLDPPFFYFAPGVPSSGFYTVLVPSILTTIQAPFQPMKFNEI